MSISISNIAWDRDQDGAVADLLGRHGVHHIDVAHSKYFPAPSETADASIDYVRRWWADRGVSIAGMQALLFGTQGLNVFADQCVQQQLLEHLRHVFRIAGRLGAGRLVFGSPRNRDRGDLSVEAANQIGATFFHQAGDLAQTEGVVLCLEPNPEHYGANFMTTTASTAEVVALTGHRHIQMQLDTGAVFMNGEEPAHLLPRYAPIIGHVHLSEPNLAELGSMTSDHDPLAALIGKHLGTRPLTIEMLPPNDGIAGIERALVFALGQYGAAQSGEHA